MKPLKAICTTDLVRHEVIIVVHCVVWVFSEEISLEQVRSTGFRPPTRGVRYHSIIVSARVITVSYVLGEYVSAMPNVHERRKPLELPEPAKLRQSDAATTTYHQVSARSLPPFRKPSHTRAINSVVALDIVKNIRNSSPKNRHCSLPHAAKH